MINNYYSLTPSDSNNTNEMTAVAVVRVESPWFSGHFPNRPILPGIAQLSIVMDLINSKNNGGILYAIQALKRVRFRQIVKPSEELFVTVMTEGKNPTSFKFNITCNGEITCTGSITTELL